jgi:ligand-binding sensor domain-containing protein
MKKTLSLAGFLLFAVNALFSQQGFTFNRIGTDDGIGLASNVVYCTYQDAKGFIWVGTANGLQRFDGSKFIQLSSGKSDRSLLVSNLTQIIPIDSTSIWLSFPYRQEFGIFNTTTFKYTRVPVETPKILISKSEFKLWKDSYGEVFLSVFSYGMLHYDKKKNKFVDDNYFKFPKGWSSTQSFFEDTIKHQYWFPCVNNGLAVFDKKSGEFFTSQHNPQNIPLLNIAKIKPTTTDVYIDRNRRFWIFNWPNGVHYKRCFDSTGKELHDTVGLNTNPDYSEMRNFYETKKGLLWMYGTNALYNYDQNEHRFYYYEHCSGKFNRHPVPYVYQVMEDHDGSIWLATDNGLYFTSPGSGTYGVVDMLFDTEKGGLEFTDILELKSGGYWLSTWGKGIYTLSKNMAKVENANLQQYAANEQGKLDTIPAGLGIIPAYRWKSMDRLPGRSYMIYDTDTQKTKFLTAPEFGGSTIRYITGDKKGNIWFATFSGPRNQIRW